MPASASRSRSRAGSSPSSAAHAARLQDHHRHAVGDGVVQLARDPRALVGDRGARLLLALELDAHDVALGRRAALLVPVHDAPDPPREQVEAALRGGLRRSRSMRPEPKSTTT